MAVLEWDKFGERTYQTGVDRGVLYLPDGTGVPWNGLISVEESSNTELKAYYIDGVKFLTKITPGDYAGVLKAFTYPDEFDNIIGIPSVSGLAFHDQPFKSFNLTYRTMVGNDVNGIDLGYKIHLLYGLIATPDNSTFESISDASKVNEFSWTLTGRPQQVPGYRATAHVSIDSRETIAALVADVEGILYGTEETAPRFPTLVEISHLFSTFGSLVIVDNGDGTWQAIDLSDDYITMLDSTTFQIEFADATFLDSNTYEISSTNV